MTAYLSPLELRGLPIEDVAGFDALREHPYGPVEHALNVAGHLGETRILVPCPGEYGMDSRSV